MCQGNTTCAVAEHQIVDADVPRDERLDLLEDRGRIEHHAGRDHIHHVRIQNPAGNVVQLVGLIAHHHRVPGVRPALVADHDLILRREQIDQLPLGFVAPLQPDYARTRHEKTPYILGLCSESKHAILGGAGSVRNVAMENAQVSWKPHENAVESTPTDTSGEVRSWWFEAAWSWRWRFSS